MKRSCDKAAAPLLKWNFKKVAAPLLKLIFPWKSGPTYISKMLKKQLLLCESKFSKSSYHRFYLLQRANGKAVFAILKQSVTGGAGHPHFPLHPSALQSLLWPVYYWVDLHCCQWRQWHNVTSPIYRTSSFEQHLLGVCSWYHSWWLPCQVSGVFVSP